MVHYLPRQDVLCPRAITGIIFSVWLAGMAGLMMLACLILHLWNKCMERQDWEEEEDDDVEACCLQGALIASALD